MVKMSDRDKHSSLETEKYTLTPFVVGSLPYIVYTSIRIPNQLFRIVNFTQKSFIRWIPVSNIEHTHSKNWGEIMLVLMLRGTTLKTFVHLGLNAADTNKSSSVLIY